MLKEILSIAGKPGLYKMISYGKNMIVVENLQTKKRQPAYSRDRIVSLGDIAIYTTDEEVPLAKVMDTICGKMEAKAIDTAQYKTDDQLDTFMKDILPNYDEDRVYKSDIKKIIAWYNLLVGAGITDFTVKEEKAEEATDDKAEEKTEE
ncbi:MAG: DUF5606 domain-containing protein [Muribaculaceae bacterium]|nr:DUF5606 domain-containing protein [Muribaculaceae bacterium]